MKFGRRKEKLKDKLEGRNRKIPVLIILVLVLLQALIGSLSLRLLLNLHAFQIIAAGIFISLFISFPTDVLRLSYRTLRASFNGTIDFEETINKVHNISIKVKKKGLLSLEEDIDREENTFIREGMILLSDYKKADAIEDILDHDIESRYVELLKPYKLMEMVANIAPAFGLIGTLVGMIGLLGKMSDPSLIMDNMASALVSTLYGSLIANFIAFPAMARIQDYNNDRLLEYRMIKEGILLIAKDDTSRNVFDKMNVMLREEKRLTYPRKVYTEERGPIDYGMERLFQEK